MRNAAIKLIGFLVITVTNDRRYYIFLSYNPSPGDFTSGFFTEAWNMKLPEQKMLKTNLEQELTHYNNKR
jgi:hypothetical protein